MLISQSAQGGPAGTNGLASVDIAELRRQLANPSTVSDATRQRLLQLARRLARVRALRDEYLRVDFSPYVAAILGFDVAAV